VAFSYANFSAELSNPRAANHKQQCANHLAQLVIKSDDDVVNSWTISLNLGLVDPVKPAFACLINS